MRYHLRRRAGIVCLLSLVGLAGAAGVAHAQNPPEEIEYYATDALGSVRIVFTPTGQVLGRSDYRPFGETLNQSGALPRERFTGQERDGEAGMDYFNARNLQARTGRMNAPDPLFGDALFSPQGWNRYSYVRNNPLALVDPSGMESEAVFKVTIVGFPAYDHPCFYTDCISRPPETISDAAREGSADQLAGAGWNSWYESLAGTGGNPYFGKHGSSVSSDNLQPKDPGSPSSPGSTAAGTNSSGDTTPPKTAKERICSVIPDGRVSGLGGGLGIGAGATGSVETLTNYSTGEASWFYSGGLHVGSNGGVNGNVHLGLVFGLGASNANFSGPFGGLDGPLGSVVGLNAQSAGKNGPVVVGASLGLSLLPVFGGSNTNTSAPHPLPFGAGVQLTDVPFILLRQLCK